MSAEERARLAEEERAVHEALAIEAEQRVAAAPTTAEQRMDFVAAGGREYGPQSPISTRRTPAC